MRPNWSELIANALATKLGRFVRMSGDDDAALDRLGKVAVRTIGAREDLIREGDVPRTVKLVLEGWACRYKVLEDGRRQVIAFFLPGDLCDLNVYILREMDHSIGSLTPLRYAEISRELFDEVTEARPRVIRAMWWELLVNAAVQREWTVNLGQRSALERIAHLLCELFLRLRAIDRVDGNSFDFPLTQGDLAEATGMTPVHVNRTVQELRARGLIEWRGKTMTIPAFDALADLALFNPNYLHLDHEGASLDAND